MTRTWTFGEKLAAGFTAVLAFAIAIVLMAGQALDTVHALGLALAAGPERWTAMEGGYPIIFDGECVGGIGVSGATWELDDQLAREAVEAIGASCEIGVTR